MTLVVTANVVGQIRGEPVRLPTRRRRLSTVVARHRPAAGRQFIVSVHRKGAEAFKPTDRSVRLRAAWKSTLVGPEDVVLITVVPLGKSFLSIGLAIASIALIAIAPYAAPVLAAAATGAAVATSAATFAVQAGLVIGGLALGYAAQAAKGAGKSQKQAELYSLSGGGNVPKPGSRRPLLYGRCWSAPPLSQGDYFLYDGDTMVLTKRMTLGIGKFQVHRIRVGDALFWIENGGLQPPFNATAAGALGTAIEIIYEQVSQIASGDVITSNAVSGQEMPRPGGNPDRTPWFRLTPQGVVADAALLSWTYPAVYRVSSSGRQVGTVAGVVFYGRKIDPRSGQVIGPEFEIQRSTESSNTFSPTPLRRSAYFRLPEPGSTYEISAQNAYPDPQGFEQQNRATWDGMSAYKDDYRIRPETTEIVLRIRAGKGLTVTAYSDIMVDATRIVPVWDGNTWVEKPTRKAVWAYCDLVRSTYGLAQPDRVDAAKALYYANLLTAQDTYDGLLPEVSSFWEAAGQILLPLRADPVKVGAVHSFVRDESRAEPRHVLTRRQIVRDSSGATYKTKVEGGDVIVEFDRDGDPKRPDEVRYSYGAPTRTPKRYKVAGITDGLHALKHATWLAAVAVFRGAERKIQTEWDGRLVYPGDHILSDLWFLRGKQAYGVASAAGRVLTLDVTAHVPAVYGYGSIRARQGKEWGILRMRGVGARGLELHPDDVAALSAQTGLSLTDVLARDTQDPTTVVLGELVELQETYVARSAIPSDPDHVQIEMVRDDARVWQLLDEQTIAPAPVNADTLAEPLIPQISVLHARCQRVETGIETVWGVSPTAGARNYEADRSYDGGATWEVLSALGPASSGRATMRQTDRPVVVRARAYGRTGLFGDWITTTFTTVAPVVQGGLVDVTTLPPLTYANLDAVIQGRLDSIPQIKTRADDAYASALGALDRAAAARTAADGAQANAVAAIARAAGAQTDATKALADAQTAYQAAVDRSAAVLQSALMRLDSFRRALAADPTVRQGYIDPIVTDVRSDLDILMRNATRNMQDIAGLRDALTTAGLEIIPGEGRVRFYAIEALQTSVGQTISNFSITVDALSRKIDLYGSVQGNDLQGLINSIASVQVTLDAQQKTITSLATSAQFTSLSARLSTAEQTISAQDAAITTRATQTSVDAQGVRISAAEQRISASEGRISQTILATQSSSIDLDLLPRTLAGFQDFLQKQQGALSQSLALATEAMSANVDAAGRATAEVRTELLVYQGDAAAQYLSITRAVADTNGALVTATTSLTAQIRDVNASLTDERSVRAAADAATTTRIDGAVSRIGLAEAGLITEQQTRAAADAASTLRVDTAISRIGSAEGRIGATEAGLVEERRTRADADGALSSRVDVVYALAKTNEASIVTEATARATADAATTTQLTSATSRIAAAEANITTEQQTRAAADTAQTTRIDGALSRIGGAEAAITTEQQTRAAADAATTLRVDGALSRIGATEAGLVTEQQTRATADAASTARIDTAFSRIGDTQASITTEATTRADADGSLSSRIDLVYSTAKATEASLITETTTRASADTAQTTRIDGAISRIAASEGRIGATEASLTTEQRTRADADAAQTTSLNAAVSRIGGVEGRVGGVEASIVTEAKTRADADTAQTASIAAAQSRIGGAEAAIAVEAKTRADADTATTSRVDAAVSRIGGVEGRIGNAEASIASEAQTRADQTGSLASRVDGLAARTGAAEGRIATVDQARADGDGALSYRLDLLNARAGGIEGSVASEASARASADGALSSRIDQVNARAGGVEGSVASEAQARAGADGALSSRIDQVSARAESALSGVANEASARASADGAFAGQINDLYARSDRGTAFGRFSMDVQSAPSGVSVRLAATASTESYGQRRNAGWFLDLLPDGTSRYVIDANYFAITANGGLTYPFRFDGTTLTIPSLRVTNDALIPGSVSQSDWHFSGGNSYLEFTVNCRPNSRLSIFAMFDGKPTTGIPINATGKLQIIRDGTLLRETDISFYVAGSNQNLAAFTLNTTTFVRDIPGAGVHTYRIQNTSGQSPVSCTWQDLAA